MWSSGERTEKSEVEMTKNQNKKKNLTHSHRITLNTLEETDAHNYLNQ